MQTLDEMIAAFVTPHAPTELWQSTSCGLSDIEIDSQGRWFHQGREIKRQSIIKLFASVLVYEDNQHILITPHEKCDVVVKDAPFIIQSWTVQTFNERPLIVCEDNLQRQWPLCERFPIQLKQYNGQTIPYLCLTNGLTARVSRNVYYQRAELAEQDVLGAYLNSAMQKHYFA